MWQPVPETSAQFDNMPQGAGALPFPREVDDSLCLVVQGLEEVRTGVRISKDRLREAEVELSSSLQKIEEAHRGYWQDPHIQDHKDLRLIAQHGINCCADLLRELLTEFGSNAHRVLEFQRSLLVEREVFMWRCKQATPFNAYGEPLMLQIERIRAALELLEEVIYENLELHERMVLAAWQLPASSSALVIECSKEKKLLGEALSAQLGCDFVVEKQPPQVLKLNTRFTTSVRMTSGDRFRIHNGPPSLVKVSIINDVQAAASLERIGDEFGEAAGEILNDSAPLEYDPVTNLYSVQFYKLSLRKIKRAEKKDNISVMDEKYCLLYQTVVKVNNMDIVVKTQSAPIVVIVHLNQESHALATVKWDNAFSSRPRVPFIVPKSVPWSALASLLSTEFRLTLGRDLSENELHYLARRAFESADLPADFNDHAFSWPKFSRIHLAVGPFSFWEWFYSAIKVTREHLYLLWKEETIMGFVGRREAEARLMTKPAGTFLLRFSESILGGVSIAWVSEHNGLKSVSMLYPFTAKDFQIRSMADRLSDCQGLVYLYPNIPKEQAFETYYTVCSSEPSRNGYVVPKLILSIPETPRWDPATLTSLPDPPDDSKSAFGYNATAPEEDIL